MVATGGRPSPVTELLRSLEQQTLTSWRLLVVDQNEDQRLDEVLANFTGLAIVMLRAPSLGLSRARNVALPQLSAEIVAFPDDDCAYGPDLLERVAGAMRTGSLDGLVGRTADPDGRPARRRF